MPRADCRRPRTRNPRNRARQGAARAVHHAYSNPVGGNPEAVRNNLREALRLFKEAGYEIRNEQLVDSKTGEPFAVEFLADDPSFERVFLFYKPSLDRLGITVTVRTVDDAQYENRLRDWDFDIITDVVGRIAVARQRAARLLGFASRRPARLAQPRSASRTRRSMPMIDASSLPRTATIWSPPPTRSTACCCGTTTSCRNGPTAKCAAPAGTASAIPIRCRNTARRRSRRSGGGTPIKRPRRVRTRDFRNARRSHAAIIGCLRAGAFWQPPELLRRAAHACTAPSDMTSSPTACRRSAISPIRPTSSTSATSIRRAEGRHVFADRTRPAIQSEFPHLQFAQQLHPQRRRGAGHGADLRHADGAHPATSPTPCMASPPRKCGARPTG